MEPPPIQRGSNELKWLYPTCLIFLRQKIVNKKLTSISERRKQIKGTWYKFLFTVGKSLLKTLKNTTQHNLEEWIYVLQWDGMLRQWIQLFNTIVLMSCMLHKLGFLQPQFMRDTTVCRFLWYKVKGHLTLWTGNWIRWTKCITWFFHSVRYPTINNKIQLKDLV